MPLSRITSLFQSATANVYSPSANTVAIRTSSTDRLTLDSSGNVGIGTGSPSAPLDVNGSVAITGSARRITGDFSTTTFANRVAFQSSTANGNTAILAIPNGTGTTAQFQASNNSDPTNSSLAQLAVVGATDVRILSGITGTGTYLPMTFYTGGSEAMRIDTSGNVGVGASTGLDRITARRDQNASTRIAINNQDAGSSAESALRLSASGATWDIANGSAAKNSNALTFGIIGSEFMRITSGGNVGIGTSSITYRVDVSAGNGQGIRFTDTVNSVQNFLGAYNSVGLVGTLSNHPVAFWTNNAERARITSAGKWIVNDTAASGNDELVVIKATSTASTAAAIRIINSAGTELFFVRNDGAFRTGTAATSPVNLTTGNAANIWVDVDGTLRKSTSSIKYKDNVQDSTHGLAEVLALRPVTYNGKNDGEKIFGGLIAEEVHDAGLSEFVAYAEDGTPDALHYGNMVSLAFKAIQEQQAMIEEMKAEIQALKGNA